MAQIILYDRDPEKDAAAEAFLNKVHNANIFEKEAKISMETDGDFEKIFIKCAEEWQPKTFTELREKVAEFFGNKLDKRLERWEKKVSLDRALLKQVFQS